MEKKKVLIVGGGISGIATGIYLQMNGYETEVLEKNHVSGGACIGWERKGCYIDGCIHWLVGVNPASVYYTMWRDIHALTEDSDVFFQNEFDVFDYDGKKIVFWADADKLQKELLAFAPEDEKEILRFCKLIKRFQKIEPPVNKPVDMMSLFQLLKIGFTMIGDYYWVTKTSKLSCEDYAARFKNPYLRDAIANYMTAGYNFMSMTYMLAHVCGRDGGIPIGGSLALTKRVEERYLSLGGKMRFNAEVEKIRVEQDRAVGVELKSGEFLPADWVVSATPVEHCLHKLLGGRYAVKKIEKRLSDIKTYPIYTYTIAVLKCSEDLSSYPLSVKRRMAKEIALDQTYSHIVLRNYAYDKTLKMEQGGTVLQAVLRGDDDMYFWWKKVKDEGGYKEAKAAFAKSVLANVEAYYPELAGKLEVIDVVTPCTYERYLNSWHGSFQGFVHTSTGKALMQKGTIKGLKNFILSGQWLIRSGGLPTAVMSGKFAAQRICKADKKKFTITE